MNVLRSNVATQEENVRLIKGQQTAGVAKPADVAQAEAQAALTRASLVTAESNVRNAPDAAGLSDGRAGQRSQLTDQMVVPEQIARAEQMVLTGRCQSPGHCRRRRTGGVGPPGGADRRRGVLPVDQPERELLPLQADVPHQQPVELRDRRGASRCSMPV